MHEPQHFEYYTTWFSMSHLRMSSVGFFHPKSLVSYHSHIQPSHLPSIPLRRRAENRIGNHVFSDEVDCTNVGESEMGLISIDFIQRIGYYYLNGPRVLLLQNKTFHFRVK